MANAIDYLKEEGLIQNMDDDAIYHYILEDYMGTCTGMTETDFDWLAERDKLWHWDNDIFLCDCGWWCDIGERRGENNCEDCYDE